MAPQQRGVHAQRLDEGVLTALERFFKRGLAHRADGGAPDVKAQRAAYAVKDKDAAAVGQIVAELPEILPLGGGRAVDPAGEDRGDQRVLVGGGAAAGIAQRTQHALGGVRAGNQPVEPADEDACAGRAGAQTAVFKIGAAAESLAQRGGGRLCPVPGRHLRAAGGYKFDIIHTHVV